MDKETLAKILDELSQIDASDGLDVNELLRIPEEVRQLLTWMVRSKRFMSDELAEHLGLNASQTGRLLGVLLRKGFVELSGPDEDAPAYRMRVTGTYKQKFRVQRDIWKLLDD